ncbi:hypothetical protein ACIBKY_55175 [Nonomuraea sp. NPDC050394]|uniref:hypothetical protein n=1 Tax=Nonomuraea sp. NPDC050394 TaxID=3364363 RepID=UPI0037B6672C
MAVPRIPALQRRQHQARVDALTGLRDQLIALGHPAGIRIDLAGDSLEIVESMEYGETARLIVWFGHGVALYIDSLNAPGRYMIDQRYETLRGVTTVTSAGRDADALRIYRRFLARYGLPERDSLG